MKIGTVNKRNAKKPENMGETRKLSDPFRTVTAAITAVTVGFNTGTIILHQSNTLLQNHGVHVE